MLDTIASESTGPDACGWEGKLSAVRAPTSATATTVTPTITSFHRDLTADDARVS
ncbi:hypothetical protein [Subtercola frigoramans]|uniref:hypothetical protein n=1 Tax=Subtercola frigoramans TaxID=120298 RepID=UPI0031D2D0C1